MTDALAYKCASLVNIQNLSFWSCNYAWAHAQAKITSMRFNILKIHGAASHDIKVLISDWGQEAMEGRIPITKKSSNEDIYINLFSMVATISNGQPKPQLFSKNQEKHWQYSLQMGALERKQLDLES